MSRWKQEIVALGTSLCIGSANTYRIVKEVSEMDVSRMPGFYKNENEYRYDVAQRKVVQLYFDTV